MEYIYLLIGFVLLIKWADVLIDWASSIAAKLWISSLMIWLTIVAFGTSAPEFFVNIIWVANWQTDLALWNILWSIIVNTLFVLWVSALIYPLHASKSTVFKEVPYLILAALALLIAASDIYLWNGSVNVISRNEWLIFLLFFIIFIVYTFWLSNNENWWWDKPEILGYTKSIIFISLGMLWLVWGWYLLVNSAETIARSWWVSESIIWLTVVAIWTSLPELAASAIAAYKKNADIAIWNVVWSNIYWIFLILWSSSTTANLLVSDYSHYDILIAFWVSMLLGLFLFFGGKRGKITRIEGGILIFLYIVYISYLYITQISNIA